MNEKQPELPPLPTSALAVDKGSQAETENWFEYQVKAQPHHTDYGGVVWHGTYLTWMETARIECLRSIGIDYAELVTMGCELPVVELSLRYHRPVSLGMSVIVKTRLMETQAVRMNWDYRIQSLDGNELFLTGQITLVGIDREKGRIMRQLPASFQDKLIELAKVK